MQTVTHLPMKAVQPKPEQTAIVHSGSPSRQAPDSFLSVFSDLDQGENTPDTLIEIAEPPEKEIGDHTEPDAVRQAPDASGNDTEASESSPSVAEPRPPVRLATRPSSEMSEVPMDASGEAAAEGLEPDETKPPSDQDVFLPPIQKSDLVEPRTLKTLETGASPLSVTTTSRENTVPGPFSEPTMPEAHAINGGITQPQALPAPGTVGEWPGPQESPSQRVPPLTAMARGGSAPATEAGHKPLAEAVDPHTAPPGPRVTIASLPAGQDGLGGIRTPDSSGPLVNQAGAHKEGGVTSPLSFFPDDARKSEMHATATPPVKSGTANPVALHAGSVPPPNAQPIADGQAQGFLASADGGLLDTETLVGNRDGAAFGSPRLDIASPQAMSGAFDFSAVRPEQLRHAAANIVDVLLRQPGKPVEISLDPKELGRVRMALSTSETGVTVVITVERAETQELMRRNIDQLAQEFQNLGYDNASFEFHRESDGQKEGHHAGNPDSMSASDMTDSPQLQKTYRLVSTGLDLRL